MVNAAICGPLPARGRGAASSRPLPAWDPPSNRRLAAAAAREEGAAAAAGIEAQTDPAWTAEMLGVAAGMTNRYGRARAVRLAAARASSGPGQAGPGGRATFASARPAAGERPGHAPPKPEAGEAFVVLLSCPVRPRGVRADAVPEFG